MESRSRLKPASGEANRGRSQRQSGRQNASILRLGEAGKEVADRVGARKAGHAQHRMQGPVRAQPVAVRKAPGSYNDCHQKARSASVPGDRIRASEHQRASSPASFAARPSRLRNSTKLTSPPKGVTGFFVLRNCTCPAPEHRTKRGLHRFVRGLTVASSCRNLFQPKPSAQNDVSFNFGVRAEAQRSTGELLRYTRNSKKRKLRAGSHWDSPRLSRLGAEFCLDRRGGLAVRLRWRLSRPSSRPLLLRYSPAPQLPR